MDDMYKSIKAFLYDRTSSPLFGAFIISWSVVNYRVILTIFSGESLSAKFEIIDQLYSVTLFDQPHYLLGLFYYGFMLPALATVSYIYLYPFLAKPVYEHSLKKQKELREIKQKEEGNRLLSHKESLEIYREMAKLENKYNQQEEKHRKQISALLSSTEESGDSELPIWAKVGIDGLRQKRKEGIKKQEIPKSQSSKLAEDLESVLRLFSGTSENERKNIHQFLDPSSHSLFNNIDWLRYAADELVQQGLLRSAMENEYYLTHKGRGYIMKQLSPSE